MDNGVRKSVEISIVGNLHYRQIIVVGGGKTNTLSTVDKDNYVMEYEEI